MNHECSGILQSCFATYWVELNELSSNDIAKTHAKVSQARSRQSMLQTPRGGTPLTLPVVLQASDESSPEQLGFPKGLFRRITASSITDRHKYKTAHISRGSSVTEQSRQR